MYNKYYDIAGIIIKVESPFQFHSYNAVDFVCEEKEADYVFQFEQVQDIPIIMEDAVPVADVMWAHEYRKQDGTYLRAFLWQDKYYSCVSCLGDKKGVCYYASDKILIERAVEGFELLMYLCVEKILLKFDALVLHSSHLNVNGNGLVFSGPSQAGKSTQAALWEKYAGAVVMNGDRSILRKVNDVWHVFGCPMCGTSNIHKQGDEPLTNIVMLAQSKENNARTLRGMEAFRLLYPQITICKWDVASSNKAMDLLNDILEEIPVWHYACTKEENAVSDLKKVIGL